MASPGRTRERAPKRPTSVAVSLLGGLVDRTLVADVLCELANVLRRRVLRLDREVGHDLRAERLRQRRRAAQPLLVRRARHERGVLEVFRPDAEHDLLPGVRGEAGRAT